MFAGDAWGRQAVAGLRWLSAAQRKSPAAMGARAPLPCVRVNRPLILGRDTPIQMADKLDYLAMLAIALQEARTGLAEGGLPIGAAIFDRAGKLIGAGHNRRVQNGDPSL